MFVSDGILITKAELARITEIARLPLRRVLFTMLCLAKYYNQRRGKNDNSVFLDTKTIFALSNTSMTAARRLEAVIILRESGLIEPLVNDITNRGHRVVFAESANAEDAELVITSMSDLGYQYER